MCATVGNWATGRKEEAVELLRVVDCLKVQFLVMGMRWSGMMPCSKLCFGARKRKIGEKNEWKQEEEAKIRSSNHFMIFFLFPLLKISIHSCILGGVQRSLRHSGGVEDRQTSRFRRGGVSWYLFLWPSRFEQLDVF